FLTRQHGSADRHPNPAHQRRQGVRAGGRRNRGGQPSAQRAPRVSEQGERGAAGARAGGGEPLMLLMIDNYDSFTYNLVQYLGELGAQVRVFRNDQLTVAQAQELAPARVVISPG